jgi:hypothetical protein
MLHVGPGPRWANGRKWAYRSVAEWDHMAPAGPNGPKCSGKTYGKIIRFPDSSCFSQLLTECSSIHSQMLQVLSGSADRAVETASHPL